MVMLTTNSTGMAAKICRWKPWSDLHADQYFFYLVFESLREKSDQVCRSMWQDIKADTLLYYLLLFTFTVFCISLNPSQALQCFGNDVPKITIYFNLIVQLVSVCLMKTLREGVCSSNFQGLCGISTAVLNTVHIKNRAHVKFLLLKFTVCLKLYK